MAEVEPFGLMNRIPNPFGEVCVPNHAFLPRVLVHHNLLEVVVVDKALLLRKVTQDVLNCYEAVVILV